jgi:hypothetical protein
MALRPIFGDVVDTGVARGAGTFTAGPIAGSGQANAVVLGVHVTAASGTSPTLNASLEESDDASTWTAVTGSAVAQLTAAGNAVAFAVPAKRYVRVTSTIAGTTPSFTYKVTAVFVGT